MRRQGFTVLELMIAVAIVGILAAIAIPAYKEMQHKVRRAELPPNVDGIRTAQLAWEVTNREYLTLPDNPDTTPNRELRPFDRTLDRWSELGWAPSGSVRGSYVVAATASDFTVTGYSDVEGDGAVCHYDATLEGKVQLRAGEEHLF